MMPTFGTSIPSLVFELLDESLVETVRSEIEAVFDFDPRVEVIRVAAVPDYNTNSVTVSADLFFVEFAVTQNMNLNIQLQEL
jgi:phage baseplate assembly protein W